MSAWLWLAGGIALAAMEMVVSGVYLLWIGLGAIVTGGLVLALPALDPRLQFVVFAVVSVLAAFVGARVYRSIATSDQPQLNRRAEQMLGRTVTLEEPIVDGIGRARIGDTVWRVQGPDLPAGSKVRVIGSDAGLLSVASEGPAAL